jgi:hypothetical protein
MNKDSNFTIIKSKELKKSIVAALVDDIAKIILDSTIYDSKTVEDIILEKKYLILLHIEKSTDFYLNSYIFIIFLFLIFL